MRFKAWIEYAQHEVLVTHLCPDQAAREVGRFLWRQSAEAPEGGRINISTSWLERDSEPLFLYLVP